MVIINEIYSRINNTKYLLKIYDKEFQKTKKEINIIKKKIKNTHINIFYQNILESYLYYNTLKNIIQKDINIYNSIIFFHQSNFLPYEIKNKIINYIKLPKKYYKSYNIINQKIKNFKLKGLRINLNIN